MNRFFTLVLAASCFTAVGQSFVDGACKPCSELRLSEEPRSANAAGGGYA